jgi:DNA-binding SARP family transcriptional activator
MSWPMFGRGEAMIDGRIIHMPPKERDLLFTLLVRHPQPVHRDELIEVLWPNPYLEPERAYLNITQHIFRINHKAPRRVIVPDSARNNLRRWRVVH